MKRYNFAPSNWCKSHDLLSNRSHFVPLKYEFTTSVDSDSSLPDYITVTTYYLPDDFVTCWGQPDVQIIRFKMIYAQFDRCFWSAGISTIRCGQIFVSWKRRRKELKHHVLQRLVLSYLCIRNRPWRSYGTAESWHWCIRQCSARNNGNNVKTAMLLWRAILCRSSPSLLVVAMPLQSLRHWTGYPLGNKCLRS